MEQTQKTFSEVTEQLQETFKNTADFYTKASLSVMDAYNKQLSTSVECYNNFFESTFRTNFSKNHETISELLKKNIENYQKTVNETNNFSKEMTEKIFKAWGEEKFFLPVNEDVTNALLTIFSEQAKLISDSGMQFFNIINKEGNIKNYSEYFNKFSGDTIKTSEQTIKNLIETYNRQAEFSQKASEQLLGNITKQFDVMTEMISNLFNDALKNFEQKEKANTEANSITNVKTKSKKK